MRNKRYVLSDSEMEFICNLRGKNIKDYVKEKGRLDYRVRLNPEEYKSLKEFRTNKSEISKEFRTNKSEISKEIDKEEFERLKKKELEADTILEKFKLDGDVELYEIKIKNKKEHRVTIPIVQYSDWHIDEVVKAKSVLGLNEYNPEIAQKRVDTLFVKTCKLIEHHQENYDISEVVIALQGDFIGGWIHEELMQTNSESPLNAIRTVRNMILSGFKYIQQNLDVEKIHVICISGNHSRNTKKIQFANFNDVSLEYGMYKDIEEISKQVGLDKFEFLIPAAEMTVVEMLGKRMLFAHGHEFKYAGGIGGIYPSMLRWFNKIAKVFRLDIAFIGHWHQSIFTPQCVVNGSIKGYDAYAMGKGLDYQPPSQNLTLLDSKYGFCLHQEIFPF
jgi:hypothetical protein